MQVAIIGAGAVGLGIASCLAAPERRLGLVVRRADTRRVLQEEGILRTGLFGERRVAADALRVEADLAALAGAALDTLLVCTKAFDTRDVAEALARSFEQIGRPDVVVCQNGWGAAEILAEQIPRSKIYSARVITGFRRDAPNRVEITVHAEAIHIGSLFGATLDSVSPLCRAIEEGGIPCAASPRIERDLWAKVLYNGLLNPLGALVGVSYGELAAGAETRRIMAACAHEIFAVMEAAGYATHWRTADEYLEDFYERQLPATAQHESSMLQDLRAGRPTEVDALCGAVDRLAREHGIDAPINRALLSLVRGAEARSID